MSEVRLFQRRRVEKPSAPVESRLTIIRGLISNLPHGTSARIQPAFQKAQTLRNHPIPISQIRVQLNEAHKRRGIVITAYPTTKVSLKKPEISFQIQLQHPDDLLCALERLCQFYFPGHIIPMEHIRYSITNVQRRIPLVPGASIDVWKMRDPHTPIGMGIAETVEERREQSGMRYRRVVDPTDPTRRRLIAGNFTQKVLICMGTCGFEIADIVTWAIAKVLCQTPGLIVLHCAEDGRYDPAVCGPRAIPWTPGVAGIPKLDLEHVFSREQLSFEPTAERISYLEAMLRNETVPN